jgi:transcription elongation factor Elf1
MRTSALTAVERTSKKNKVNYKIKQAIEEISFSCPFCNQEYTYGEQEKHTKSCLSISSSYVCPNEGCGHGGMQTKRLLRKHLKKC